MAALDLQTEFVGRKKHLFWLALRTSLLTVLTLGMYRFWMKTRLRRWYWSAIRPGGVPLEYVGQPLEKLLGFLVAVVILAFYIGVVNLILMFVSFSLLNGAGAAYALSFIGVIPIIFFASYRARRYILARTRWRGIRFGLEPGAWGYAVRCIMHWFLSLISLGLLAPRQKFYLEKYRIDRTYFGDAQMLQGGSWGMLYPAMAHVIIGTVITAATLAIAGANESPRFLALLVISVPWMGFGLVHYNVRSFQLLAAHKRLGGIGFDAKPRVWRVLRIYLLGYLIVFLALGLLLMLVGVVFVTIFEPVFLSEILDAPVRTGRQPDWLVLVFAAPAYFLIFVLWGVLRNVFVTMPLARHYAETLTLTGTENLDQIQQRGRDEFVEAEGFADALDVGAAL